MGISTIAVAVGILGEYVAHFVFEEEVRRNKREMAVSILFGVLGGWGGPLLNGSVSYPPKSLIPDLVGTRLTRLAKKFVPCFVT